MFKISGQNFILIFIIFVLVCLSTQNGDTECSDKQYAAFEECCKKQLPFKCAKSIVVAYPKCFFQDTSKVKSKNMTKKECASQCNLQYERCDASTRNRKVLLFPCKIGLNVCMTGCHQKTFFKTTKLSTLNKATHRCQNQCKSDFRECFSDIKSFPQSMICTETNSYCKKHRTCYRLTTYTDTYRITFMMLRRKLMKIYS